MSQLKAQNNALSKALIEAKACLAASEFFKERAEIKGRKYQTYTQAQITMLLPVFSKWRKIWI